MPASNPRVLYLAVNLDDMELRQIDFARLDKSIGEAQPLRALRRAAGLTQAALATQVGCSRVYISLLETGRHTGDVTLGLARRMARTLGVSLDAISEFAEPVELESTPAEP